ncbi:hypothetical protein AVEN_204820-1 [Araneus ventricosus]|uniref:MULE transposase domain-containing protein n=1 Tax=Araneus ventricosus TaxID=182803 RepID=A0A4Y2RNV7_ARAVE|nr:hypothetical protein AVEN_204820-1 [Araneus ventricosus]
MNEDPLAVLILTPLKMRAHGIQECENIVFVDSTSSSDAENHCITLMLIPCAAGSIPIAIIITKDETENSYTVGLNLLKETLKPLSMGKVI